jgi:hypothetical protein
MSGRQVACFFKVFIAFIPGYLLPSNCGVFMGNEIGIRVGFDSDFDPDTDFDG